MERLGAFAAKTHLSALLERVEKGETIEITRRGKAIARLVPVTDAGRVGAAIDRLKALRAVTSLAGLSIRELKEEGRP